MSVILLTKENLRAWKQEFDAEIKLRSDIEAYSQTESDSYWLELYPDISAEAAATIEIANWRD